MSPLVSLSAQFLAAEPAHRAWVRLFAAALLQRASQALARSARQLARVHPQAAPAADASQAPCVEFHAEAGAPEGALYVDGELVARLPGVNRL